MKIKTITCHDVYNAGASLQAFALMKYLIDLGHDVEIIDYKPDYLSKHYNLLAINNPKYEHSFLKYPYIIAKLPSRLVSLKSKRKKDFDEFKREYLKVTKKYTSYSQLVKNPPKGDIYIAGSDQIWNTFFKNGFDPAFYMQFGNKNVLRMSYAASFAVDEDHYTFNDKIKKWLDNVDKISVREQSGINILKKYYQINGTRVLDPVFLLSVDDWNLISNKVKGSKEHYIFINDFDGSELIKSIALTLAKEKNLKIAALQSIGYEDYILDENLGPLGFLNAIANAEYVISNSFHACAFSIIFHKKFFVVNREENINARIDDLLELFNLNICKINANNSIDDILINWNEVDEIVESQRENSIAFLNNITLRKEPNNEY